MNSVQQGKHYIAFLHPVKYFRFEIIVFFLTSFMYSKNKLWMDNFCIIFYK